jgi:hypothetical protein
MDISAEERLDFVHPYSLSHGAGCVVQERSTGILKKLGLGDFLGQHVLPGISLDDAKVFVSSGAPPGG